MKFIIISNDKLVSRLIEIELLVMYDSKVDIAVCTDIKDISQYSDENNLIIMDFDAFDPKAASLISKNVGIIAFGKNQIAGQRYCDVFLRRPFLLSVLRKMISEFNDGQGRMPEIHEKNKHVNNFKLVPEKMLAVIDGKNIFFSETEFKILEILYENRGKAVSRDCIAKLISGNKSNSVDVYVCMIRRKIDTPFDSRFIRTVRGEGYIFNDKSKID